MDYVIKNTTNSLDERKKGGRGDEDDERQWKQSCRSNSLCLKGAIQGRKWKRRVRASLAQHFFFVSHSPPRLSRATRVAGIFRVSWLEAARVNGRVRNLFPPLVAQGKKRAVHLNFFLFLTLTLSVCYRCVKEKKTLAFISLVSSIDAGDDRKAHDEPLKAKKKKSRNFFSHTSGLKRESKTKEEDDTNVDHHPDWVSASRNKSIDLSLFPSLSRKNVNDRSCGACCLFVRPIMVGGRERAREKKKNGVKDLVNNSALSMCYVCTQPFKSVTHETQNRLLHSTELKCF